MLDIEYYHKKNDNDFYRRVNHIVEVHDIYGRRPYMMDGVIRANDSYDFKTKILCKHLKKHFKSKYNYDFEIHIKKLVLTDKFVRGTVAWGRILLDGKTSDLVHLKMKYL